MNRTLPFFVGAASSLLFLQPAPRCEVAPAEAASFKVKFLEMKTKEEAIRSRWIKDEENWRKLPARAWPPTQPSEDDIESLKGKVASLCVTRDEACRDAEFLLATCLFFNGLDLDEGFNLYKKNADEGHSDSAAATGVCIVEDFCRNIGEEAAVSYLKKSYASGNLQAGFELGVLAYIGNVDAVPLDEKQAAAYFKEAAESGHTGAQYMYADMIAEREGGVPADYTKALVLFYEAAEKGHRFSRQQFLKIMDGRHEINKALNVP